jgi:hypothetical protein
MALKFPGLTGMFSMTTSLRLGRWGVGLLEKTSQVHVAGIWQNFGTTWATWYSMTCGCPVWLCHANVFQIISNRCRQCMRVVSGGHFFRLNIAALPSGAILDHCGPRATGTFFCMVVAVGCVIFSQGPANELAYTFGFLNGIVAQTPCGTTGMARSLDGGPAYSSSGREHVLLWEGICMIWLLCCA